MCFVLFFIFRNLWGAVNYGQSLHGLHNTKSLRTPVLVNLQGFFFRALLKNKVFHSTDLFFCYSWRDYWYKTLIHWQRKLPSCRSGNSNPWSYHHWRSLCTLVPQTLCSIGFVDNVTFTCNGSTCCCPHKGFLIPHLTCPTLNKFSPQNSWNTQGVICICHNIHKD